MSISLTFYLLKRLKELKIDHMFGVPGDYNLPLLEILDQSKIIEWVGTCNELNAAYASDGYARIRGMGALLTTYGVGELSAINAIAGAFAENIPIVSIVGMPHFSLQRSHRTLHHSLNQPDFEVYSKMAAPVTFAQCIINPETPEPAKKIDQLLEISWLQKKPVYLGISMDMANHLVENITCPLRLTLPHASYQAIKLIAEEIGELIKKAKNPVCLIDDCAIDLQFSQQILQFIEKIGIPFAETGMGKGVFSEKHSQYLGLYQGQFSQPPYLQEFIEQSDLVLVFQPIYADFGTGAFTAKLPKQTIEIYRDHIKMPTKIHPVFYTDFFSIIMDFLNGVTFAGKRSKWPEPINLEFSKEEVLQAKDKDLLNHDIFWAQIASVISEDAIVISETGTSAFGSRYLKLSEKNNYILQALWFSIGYSVGATLGAALANSKRRVFAFIGDGSFQVTAQELSTLLRLKTNPVIFLINNEGYTIERYFHGMNNSYNDIVNWHYTELLKIFNGENYLTFQVKTVIELKRVEEQIKLEPDKLIFIEVILPKDDAPLLLKNFVAKVKSHN